MRLNNALELVALFYTLSALPEAAIPQRLEGKTTMTHQDYHIIRRALLRIKDASVRNEAAYAFALEFLAGGIQPFTNKPCDFFIEVDANNAFQRYENGRR